MTNSLTKFLIKLYTHLKPISVGTKFFPTNEIETEYVELFNFTQTILLEIEKAEITSDSILTNLKRDIGPENMPEDFNFYEIKAAENKIEEYALVSNIIMGSDRYFYIMLQRPSSLINVFEKMIYYEGGEILELDSTEIVAKMPSKNDAIRLGIKMIGMGLEKGIPIVSAVGMTGAAAIERSLEYTDEVGNFPGIAFTKLGGEYALVFESPFKFSKGKSEEFDNYLFIDLIDSTKFISKYGRNKLVELMTGIRQFIESECEAEIEGYREGGDDFIARFPSKDLAIRAGLDAAWFAANNNAKIRAGIGKSRREAGQRAQLVDSFNSTSPLSLVIFELANGLYAYNIPTEFSRTLINMLDNKKGKLVGVFIFVFVLTFLLCIFGFGLLSFVAVAIAIIYALVI
ncbi:MAG: hypothetical protein Q4P18_02280 [Methanobrevibacter sp.]|uniref:hypothetical protein n=1 Tax=Methanobrevibacter sp. TaxID=66852 RepID=UPI0026DFB5C9|nr:hypothetical protein [Methanobrevibacter sp.]MDO5848338.1 hypothetical protein [Methanobrevibacter sp.]